MGAGGNRSQQFLKPSLPLAGTYARRGMTVGASFSIRKKWMVSRASRIARRLGPRTYRAGAVAERRRALFDVPLRRTTERVAQPSRCEAYVRSSHSAEQGRAHHLASIASGPHRLRAPFVSQGSSFLQQRGEAALYRRGRWPIPPSSAKAQSLYGSPANMHRNDTQDSGASLNRSTDLSSAVMQNDAKRRGN
jgi:hypothetical protein